MAEKVDKGVKRKRNTQGFSKPSKKVAIEDERKVEISLQEAEKWSPIIGTDRLLSWPVPASRSSSE
jgi:DNA-directed RNA polymerase I subunit RPA49